MMSMRRRRATLAPDAVEKPPRSRRMIVFETILAMLAIGVLILGLARRRHLPYPVLLSVAGRRHRSGARTFAEFIHWSPSWYWRSS